MTYFFLNQKKLYSRYAYSYALSLNGFLPHSLNSYRVLQKTSQDQNQKDGTALKRDLQPIFVTNRPEAIYKKITKKYGKSVPLRVDKNFIKTSSNGLTKVQKPSTQFTDSAASISNSVLSYGKDKLFNGYGLNNTAQNLKNPVYTSYSKNDEVRLVTIGLASANRIRQWAEKTLPNGKVVGEVTNANTLHHKTFKPQKGGLFCERIFGPLKDFQCACTNNGSAGKRVIIPQTSGFEGKESFFEPANSTSTSTNPALKSLTENYKRFFCAKCDVEYTWSVIRRYQLGYIKLNAPVTHVWYVKGNPSYISLLLDMKKKNVESLTYCTETLTLENSLKGEQAYPASDSPSDIFSAWQKVSPTSLLGQKQISKKESFFVEARSTSYYFQNASLFFYYFFLKNIYFLKKNNKKKWQPLTKKKEKTQFSFKLKKTDIRTIQPISGSACSRLITKYKNLQNRSEVITSLPDPQTYISNNLIPDVRYIGSEAETASNKLENYNASGYNKYNYTARGQAYLLQITLHLKSYLKTANINWLALFVLNQLQPIEYKNFYSTWLSTAHLKKNKLPLITAVKDRPLKEESIFGQGLVGFTALFFIKKNKTPQKNLNCFFAAEPYLYIKNHRIQNRTMDMPGVSKTLNILMFLIKTQKAFLSYNGFIQPVPAEVNKVMFRFGTKPESIAQKTWSYAIYITLQKLTERFCQRQQLKLLNLWNKTSDSANMAEGRNAKTKIRKVQKTLSGATITAFTLRYPEKFINSLFLVGLLYFYKKNRIIQKLKLLNIPYVGLFNLKPHVFAFTNNTKNSKAYGLEKYINTEKQKPSAILWNSYLMWFNNQKTLFGKNTNITFLDASFKKNIYVHSGQKNKQNITFEAERVFKQKSHTFLNDLFCKRSLKRSGTSSSFAIQKIKDFGFIFFFCKKKNTDSLQLGKSFLSSNLAMPFLTNKDYGSARNNIGYKNQKRKFKNVLFLNSGLFINKLIFFVKKLTLVKTYIKKPSFCMPEANCSILKPVLIQENSIDLRPEAKRQFLVQKRYYTGLYKNKSSLSVHKFAGLWLTILKLISWRPPAVTQNTYMDSWQKINKQYCSTKLNKPINNQTSFKVVTTSLVRNNIYCFSHRELWDQAKDWQFFALYFWAEGLKNQNLDDTIIPNYRNRFYSSAGFDLNGVAGLLNQSIAVPESKFENEKPTGPINNLSSPLSSFEVGTKAANSAYSLVRPEASKDTSLSVSFSGGGIIKTLLADFDYFEMKKIDKQNRILLYDLNKFIRKFKQTLWSISMQKVSAPEKSLIELTYLNTYTQKPGKPITFKNYYSATQKLLRETCKQRDAFIRRTKFIRKLFKNYNRPEAVNVLRNNSFTGKNNNLNLEQDFTNTFTYGIEQQLASMILTVLPVLPPDLRPIVKMENQIAASDLNRLYQRVIYRNDRLKKFLKDPTTSGSYEMKYAQRLLQEAVDNLIQNGKSGVVPEKDARGRALKSLSDLLKGKQGRFRQYLLGKRVDYSGRSVIVVGPRLKLHECGIPKEMALELYLPFLIKRILNENFARTVIGAKALIQKNKPLTWSLLREIMKTCPVLLNRAPTLHRLGFQAFQPKLVDGRAILLHPLVCPAFNADFDGDQMAVHIPISPEARAEAWKLMLSRNNLLSPATGEPLVLPSQDMVLGCYYLTTNSNIRTQKYAKGYGQYFDSLNDVLRAYHLGLISVHTVVWVKWNGHIENTNDLEQPLELRINRYGYSHVIYSKSQTIFNTAEPGKTILINKIIKTTPGKILFNVLIR